MSRGRTRRDELEEEQRRAILEQDNVLADARMKPIIPKCNYNATGAPAVTDDLSKGYTPGSIWVNVTGDKAYICVDATVGAAIWRETSAIGAPGSGSMTSVKEAGSLVGTADAVAIDFGAGFDVAAVGTDRDVTLDLSEIAAGGELAGFMDAPTVDATHSGSAHHNPVTLGDTQHSLATQVLSGTAAGAAQAGHVTTAAQTFSGVKTFADGILTDTVDEETLDAGVTVEDVLLKDKYIQLSELTLGECDDQVDTSLNDAHENALAGQMGVANSYLMVTTNDLDVGTYWGGVRFDNGPFPPKGSVVTAAYISGYLWDTGGDDAYMDIYADDQAGPLAFTTTASNISDRTLTTASVPWIANGIAAGGVGWYDSPSLVTVIQELVTAYDVTSIALVLNPRRTAGVAKSLHLYAYDQAGNVSGAKLHIEWAAGPTGVANTATVYAKEDTDTVTKLYYKQSDDTEIGPLGTGGGAGAIGPIGPPGIDGGEGEPGEIGPPGPTGAAGAAGSAGAAGAAGIMGPPGIDGEDGEPGPPIPGPAGAAGSTGAAGPAGVGLMGPPGWDGEQGEMGPPGPPGIQTLILSERATQAVAAATTISVTDGTPITPFTTSGNITNTAAPFIAAGRDGQLVILRNDNGSGTLTISDTNIGAGGSLLRLSANTVTMAAGSSMALIYSTIQAAWVEEWYMAMVAVTPAILTHTINIGAGASNTQDAEVANAGTHTPTFAWTFTGVPSSGTVNIDAGGGEVNPADYPATISAPFTSLVGPAFNKGTSVGTVRSFYPSIVVNSVTKTTPTASITYINRKYWGPSTETTTLTTAQILGLDADAHGGSMLSTIVPITFYPTIEAGEYFWFAYRSALRATLYLTIQSEIAGFTEKQQDVDHTNDSGFEEHFDTWRATTAAVGAVTAVVSTSAGTNRFYMGPSTDTDPISNANILALDDTADGESGLYSTQARTWSAIKIEAGEYLWYCHPDRVADLATIKDGTTGFAIAGSYRTNVSHTNQYGYIEDYRCWRSDNTGIYPSGENIVIT